MDPGRSYVRRHQAAFLPFAFACAAMLVLAGPGAAEVWEHEEPEVILEGLDWPVDLAFGGDGYLYYAILDPGEIRRVHVETRELDDGFVMTFPDALRDSPETGFFSLALTPDFHETGVLYASYTTRVDGNWTNVLSRATLVDETGAHEQEVLLTRPGGEFHNGGRLMVANGYLWWTSGDTIHWQDYYMKGILAQEDGNRIGKIMRLTMDGEPAPGNPWGDHAYTKGHRNVFGIAWDPVNERVFNTENAAGKPGFMNIVEAGANYGWPHCEGYCDPPQENYTDPVWQMDRNVGPTGATWFRGAFWWGTVNQGELHRTSDHNGTWWTETVLQHQGNGGHGPSILGVATGPDYAGIWYTTTQKIVYLPFTSHDDWPQRTWVEEGPHWWEVDRDGPEEGPAGDDDEGGGPVGFTPGVAPVLLLVVLLPWLARRRNQACTLRRAARSISSRDGIQTS